MDHDDESFQGRLAIKTKQGLGELGCMFLFAGSFSFCCCESVFQLAGMGSQLEAGRTSGMLASATEACFHMTFVRLL